MTPAIASASATAQNGTTRSGTTLAASFDSFLQLLTAQLQHQDPLSPLDATQFTNQLVQFSAVEQAIQTNSKLGQLTALVEQSSLTSALGLIGRDVAFDGDQVSLGATGGAQIDYRLPSAAHSVTVTIRNEQGAAVRQLAGPVAAGSHSLAWDGSDAAGARAAPGLYRLELAAVDAEGKPLTIERSVRGIVQGVATGSDGPSLSINGVPVALSSIRNVRPAPSTSIQS